MDHSWQIHDDQFLELCGRLNVRMKYEKLNEPVFVQSVTARPSKHGNEIWEIGVVGIKSQKNYRTYVDPYNANFRRWEHIVDVGERKGVVLNNLKFKDPVKGIVNADSQFTIEYIVTKEELATALAEFWDSQNKFQKWFG